VRNRGTIGGSVSHADPAGDWPTALLVLGAKVEIAGSSGRRTVPLEDFQVGAFTVALEPEEVVCGFEIPALSAKARWGHYKVCRKPGEFADSIGTVVIDPDRGFARAVLGATDGAPLMLPAVAERLAASGADGFGIEEAKQAIADAGATFDSYLTQIHAVALSRAAKGAFA
jgi:carbon-monoxide dehydrogenase medium subunit